MSELKKYEDHDALLRQRRVETENNIQRVECRELCEKRRSLTTLENTLRGWSNFHLVTEKAQRDKEALIIDQRQIKAVSQIHNLQSIAKKNK